MGVMKMCFKMPKPKAPEITGMQITPETNAEEPDAPIYGGTEDTFNKRKGRQQLTIARGKGYNPTNI